MNQLLETSYLESVIKTVVWQLHEHSQKREIVTLLDVNMMSYSNTIHRKEVTIPVTHYQLLENSYPRHK